MWCPHLEFVAESGVFGLAGLVGAVKFVQLERTLMQPVLQSLDLG